MRNVRQSEKKQNNSMNKNAHLAMMLNYDTGCASVMRGMAGRVPRDDGLSTNHQNAANTQCEAVLRPVDLHFVAPICIV